MHVVCLKAGGVGTMAHGRCRGQYKAAAGTSGSGTRNRPRPLPERPAPRLAPRTISAPHCMVTRCLHAYMQDMNRHAGAAGIQPIMALTIQPTFPAHAPDRLLSSALPEGPAAPSSGSAPLLKERGAWGNLKCVWIGKLVYAAEPAPCVLWVCRGPAPRLEKCLAACSMEISFLHLRACAAAASRPDAPLLSIQCCASLSKPAGAKQRSAEQAAA